MLLASRDQGGRSRRQSVHLPQAGSAREMIAEARPAPTQAGTDASTCTNATESGMDTTCAYFHSENVTSPIDFGCAEGTKALVNKDIQLRVLAQRAGIAETEFDHILFFDDTAVNVEGAAAIGVSAHEARPFTQAVWEAKGGPWCRRHGIELLLQSDAPAALHECGIGIDMGGFASSPLPTHDVGASGAGNSSNLSSCVMRRAALTTSDSQGTSASARTETIPAADVGSANMLVPAVAASAVSVTATAVQSVGTAGEDEDISWV